MFRLMSVILLVLMLLVVLYPNSYGDSMATAQEDETVTLVIWGEPGTVGCANDPEATWEFCNYVRELIAEWEAMYPNIELVWEDHGWDVELRENLLTAIEEGNAPDITVGEAYMPEMVQQGLFIPLELTEEERENLIPATVQAVTYEDEIYGVAAFTGVFTLEINADVFWIAGLNPDVADLSTWDGVAEAASQITEAGDGDFYGYSILGPTPAPIAALFRVAPYMYQNGADFCNMPDCDTPTFNDPAAVPVYEWFREMYAYAPPELVFDGNEGYIFSQLFAGFTAIQTAGSWHPSWAAGSGCVDCRYLPLPLPEDGQQANVVVGNAMYAVLAESEHPEEAELFVKWLVDDEMQNNVFWTGVTGRLPTTFSAIALLYQIQDGDTEPVPGFYTEALNRSLDSAPAEVDLYDAFLNELVNGNVRTLPPWQRNGNELNVLWNEMFTEILSTEEPIEAILDTYQARAMEIVEGSASEEADTESSEE